MKKAVIYLLLLALTQLSAWAQESIDQAQKMKWWEDARFGMFVHWGPYCMYGGVYNGHNQRRGGAEWIMNRCKIPVREYRATAQRFNPVGFSADSLAAMAKRAGMKYLVITTKHHDGFAMFKSDASKFNILDYTPYNRDIIDDVVKACKKYGIKPGFYYSQSQDWCNPGGSTARKLMWEGWANLDSAEINEFTATHHGAWDHLQIQKTFNEYFHDVALPQIKELLSRYGDEIGVIFFDTPQQISKEQAQSVMDELKNYPHIIVNDRLKRPDFPGDYKTPEGRVPKSEDIEGVYWETCMNIGSSWGYKSWDKAWKSGRENIRNLALIASLGGNYLLNVGPDPNGDIPEPARKCLEHTGKWLAVNGDAIYGTRRSHLTAPWGVVTRKDGDKATSLYLCVFNWPENGELTLDCPYKARKASMLMDGSNLSFKSKNSKLTVQLPSSMPDEDCTVVRIDLNKRLKPEHLISNAEKVFKIVDAD